MDLSLYTLIGPFIFEDSEAYNKYKNNKMNEMTKHDESMHILESLQNACMLYKSNYGEWPNNLDQTKDLSGLENLNDPWENKVQFVPYRKQKGFGVIMTGGSDGVYKSDPDDYRVMFGEEITPENKKSMGVPH